MAAVGATPEAMDGSLANYWERWPAPRAIAFYRIGPYKLWGATYNIVRPLLPRLLAGEWQV